MSVGYFSSSTFDEDIDTYGTIQDMSAVGFCLLPALKSYRTNSLPCYEGKSYLGSSRASLLPVTVGKKSFILHSIQYSLVNQKHL